jgi:hypothetical protein
VITKAQASRMRRGYELWHITARNKDGTPVRCFVHKYAHFTKRHPGAFLLTCDRFSRTPLAHESCGQVSITEMSVMWVRPCDWRAAVMSYTIDHNGELPPGFKLGKAQLKLMRKGQPTSREMG